MSSDTDTVAAAEPVSAKAEPSVEAQDRAALREGEPGSQLVAAKLQRLYLFTRLARCRAQPFLRLVASGRARLGLANPTSLGFARLRAGD